ncbi:MAG: hydrogenase maturation nickel metallochaperone HypA [Bacteroidota bacterium]
MHEMSLALEVIGIASREAKKNKVTSILEMDIEVGDLSGVEADAFESALKILVVNTLLEKTQILIIRKPGFGKCIGCNKTFEMKERTTSCPVCRCFPSEISGGQEFRVISMLAE